MKNANTGFTLIELLAAIAISAVLSVMVYGGLDNVLRTEQHLSERASEIDGLQTLFTHLEHDLEQAVPRATRDRLGDGMPGFRAVPDQQVLLSLTVAARNDSQLLAGRGRLQRIDYRLQDGQLYRDAWAVLDRAHDSEPVETLLLGDVEGVQWRYLGLSWQNHWPQNAVGFDRLPTAVEVSISLPGERQYQRLFLLGGT